MLVFNNPLSRIIVALTCLVFFGCDSNDSSSISEELHHIPVYPSPFVAADVQVHFPPPVSSTEADTVTVRGSSKPAANVASVLINGATANTDDNYATWRLPITLTDGANTVAVTYLDDQGQTSDVSTLQISRAAEITSPKQFVFDEPNNQFYVLDIAHNAILVLDGTTGLATKLSSDGDNLLSNPRLITADFAGNRLIVYQNSDTRFISIDLSSGEHTALSDKPYEGDSLLADAITSIQMGNTGNLLIADSQQVYLDASQNVVGVEDAIVKAVGGVIYSQDISTGVKTIYSGYGTPTVDNSLSKITTMTYVPGADNLYAIDYATKDAGVEYRLIKVDASTGAREVINTTEKAEEEDPEDLYRFNAPTQLAWDEASQVLWLLDNNMLVTFDPATDKNTIVSSSTLPENGDYSLFWLNDLQASGVAYTLSDTLDQVLKVEPDTGKRTLVAGAGIQTPDNQYNFRTPGSIILDGPNKTLYIADKTLPKIFSVSLTTGEKTSVSAPPLTEDDVTNFQSPVTISDGPDRNVIYVLGTHTQIKTSEKTRTTSTVPAFYSVNKSTEDQDIVTHIPNTSINFNDLIYSKLDNAFYSAENQWVRQMKIDRNGQYSSLFLSTNSRDNSRHIFNSVRAIAEDTINNRLLVADSGKDIIFAVDKKTGAREILSGPLTEPVGHLSLQTPIALQLDEVANRVLALDSSLKSIIAVDLDTGARTLESNSEVFKNPRDFVYIPELDVAYILDDILDSVIAIDLETQEAVNFVR